jgi:hypothetical protein
MLLPILGVPLGKFRSIVDHQKVLGITLLGALRGFGTDLEYFRRKYGNIKTKKSLPKWRLKS